MKESTYLQMSPMKNAIMIDALAAYDARSGFCSPSRLPIRTDVATARANGAWKVVDAETSSTD